MFFAERPIAAAKHFAKNIFSGTQKNAKNALHKKRFLHNGKKQQKWAAQETFFAKRLKTFLDV